jgi:hypothetical protein
VFYFGVSVYFEIVMKSLRNVALNSRCEKPLTLGLVEKIPDSSFLDSDSEFVKLMNLNEARKFEVIKK